MNVEYVVNFQRCVSIRLLVSSDGKLVLFMMLYKVVLTFESVDEILKCDHSNESY